jgi:DNA-binding NtrC family response regulator
MRPRFRITADDILAVLNERNGDLKAAAEDLEISERTLRRRLHDFHIKPVVRYEQAEAA